MLYSRRIFLIYMNLTHYTTLALLATVPAMVSSCGDKPGASNTSEIARNIKERSAAYASLATIPADAECVFAIHNIGPTVRNLVKDGILPVDAANEDVTMWDGGAIALGPQAVKDLKALSEVYRQVFRIAVREALENSERQNIDEIALETFAQAIKGNKIGPVYVSVSATSENAGKLAELYAQTLQKMKDDAPEMAGYVETAGMKGFKFANVGAAADQAGAPPVLVKALAGRDIYLLSKQVGSSVVVAVAEDPADISIPETPEKSILGTNKLAKGDSSLHGTALLSGYASPEAVNVLHSLNDLSPIVDEIVDWLQSNPKHISPDIHRTGMMGTAKLATEIKKVFHQTPPKHEDYMKVWLDDSSIHVDVSFDAGNCRFKPGKLLVAPADSAFAAVYMETSPCEGGYGISLDNITLGIRQALPMIAAMGNAGEEALAMQIPAIDNILDKTCTALKTIGSATTGGGMLLVQENGATAAATLENRKALETGWSQLLDAARAGLKMVGENPAAVDELLGKVTATTVGSATVYVPQMGKQTDNFTPAVAVSNGVLALGTHPSAAAKVANTDLAAAPEFSGFKFFMNTQALAGMMAKTNDPKVDSIMEDVCNYVKSISASANTQDGTCNFSIEIKTK